MKNSEKTLNVQQKAFCEHYAIHGNGTQAAIYAKYSEKTAYSQANRLLKHAEVVKYIQGIKNERAERLKLRADDILFKIKTILEADLTDLIEIEPSEIKKLPIEIRRLITQVKVKKSTYEGGESTLIEFKFMDKDKALESAAKHIGFYKEDNKSEVLSKHTFDNFNFLPKKDD